VLAAAPLRRAFDVDVALVAFPGGRGSLIASTAPEVP
jgi:hypothetical protein